MKAFKWIFLLIFILSSCAFFTGSTHQLAIAIMALIAFLFTTFYKNEEDIGY